jgi:hypothetical protein
MVSDRLGALPVGIDSNQRWSSVDEAYRDSRRKQEIPEKGLLLYATAAGQHQHQKRWQSPIDCPWATTVRLAVQQGKVVHGWIGRGSADLLEKNTGRWNHSCARRIYDGAFHVADSLDCNSGVIERSAFELMRISRR